MLEEFANKSKLGGFYEAADTFKTNMGLIAGIAQWRMYLDDLSNNLAFYYNSHIVISG